MATPDQTTAKQNRAFASSIFANYEPAELNDELLNADRQPRSHWSHFVNSVEHLGPKEVSRRWRQAKRLIQDNGIAFGAYGDPTNKPRPWHFDAFPMLLERQEWEIVERGLLQRAQVLELTLQDLYGPKQLIRDGVLPPEIIYSHPGFYTALHGLQPALNRYLHCYAADLGRGSDGRWWLLGDRCEAPSGAGYALENRVVCSRMFPEAFRGSQVFRLASYFDALKDTCQQIAPRHRDNPRIVLLSQGPTSENYFEDAYLSRYLGYTLVEGSDLVVRDRAIWWKTLGGLYPVDVIVRRPNTSDCDSLELPTMAQNAIPGLIDAVRANNVAITNPLGSGLVESPIFMAYIGPLCQALLGQKPALPSVATWWCGDDSSRAYVLNNLERLEIKRAFRQRGQERNATLELRNLTSEQLVERIRKNPGQYVGQERVIRSTLPNWNDGTISRASLALRAFLVAKREGYEVLPGGLSRTAESDLSLDLSLAEGEGSKDTWVQGADDTPHISAMHGSADVVQLRRSGDDLPSRVADDIYWMGRHIQRADFGARLLRKLADRLSSGESTQLCPVVNLLLRTMADQGHIEPGFVVDGMRDQLPNIVESLPRTVFDSSSPGSLSSILRSTYRTASHVRDRLSVDSWRVLSRIDESFRKPNSGNFDINDLLHLSSELIINLASFGGLIAESMTRTQAFHFMDLGIRIERATQTASLLSCAFSTAAPNREGLETLLQICDSRMTYRYRYLTSLSDVPVLDLLITDDTNPRSIIYQLLTIKDHIDRLPRTDDQPITSLESRILLTVLYQVRMFDVESMGNDFSSQARNQLLHLCQIIDEQVPKLSQAITNKYLLHAGQVKLLTSMERISLEKA